MQSGRGVFPEFVGKPRWVDERTFVWPMKLKPETDYWFSVNGTRFTNFRVKTGEPAESYPVSFRTKAAGAAVAATTRAAPAEVAKANKEAVARLRKAIDEEYAYRDLRNVVTVGMTTAGSCGNPRTIDLGNDVG